MDEQTVRTEEIHISGDMLVSKIKELVREGNIRRVVIKNEEGRTLVEFPVTVGVVGAVLHVDDNLTTDNLFVTERFIRGAPVLAPLLFANMGTLGLIALLDPSEGRGTDDPFVKNGASTG